MGDPYRDMRKGRPELVIPHVHPGLENEFPSYKYSRKGTATAMSVCCGILTQQKKLSSGT
jgi:hypothetical protein